MADTSPAKISYINKTYQDERAELIAHAPIVSNGTWTDLNNADLLVALIELVLGDSDMNRYYMDHQANEAFLETSRERKNVINHCNQISYRVKAWSPAQGSVSVKLISNQLGYISIPQYTKLWAETGLPYFTTQEVFLSDGQPFADIPLLQGDVQTVTYQGTGNADQKYLINSDYIGEGTISVTVNNQLWVLVDDYFAKSGPYSTNFILETLPSGLLRIVFGDGISGAIPVSGSTIVITWANTMGPLGNIDENKIIRFDEPINNISIYYSSLFSGGASPETIESAKKLAPMNLRALWRGVHREDYATLAEDYPGIKQAAVLDINDFPLYSFKISYHETWIVLIPSNDGLMSESMQQGVLNFLEERKYTTNHIIVIDADYVAVDIDATLYKRKDFDPQIIENNATTNIKSLFKIAKSPLAQYRLYGTVDGLVLGESFRYSKLIYSLQSVPGVAYVEVSTPLEDILMNYQQIPVLGELRLNILDAEESLL